LPAPCPAAAQAFPAYTATTGATFTLHTTLADQPSAEAMCNREGGHLASFTSLREQVGQPAGQPARGC
jgi:hypothetical protein